MRLGADLGRRRLVRAGRGAAAGDARRQDPVGTTVDGGGVPFILGELPSGLQDFLLLLIIFAFFSCGTSVQGAGSRLAFSYARDGALPGSRWLSAVQPPVQDPDQRAARRRRRHGAVRAAGLLLARQGRPHRLHHLPGQHQRPGGAGLLRGQRHLPVVPAHRDRGDRRAGARLGPGGPLHARPVGVDGDDHRRGLPRADARQRRRADRA